jgi:hypothetical protein
MVRQEESAPMFKVRPLVAHGFRMNKNEKSDLHEAVGDAVNGPLVRGGCELGTKGYHDGGPASRERDDDTA